MGHGRRLQCPMEAPPLVTCLPSPPGCAHRGAGVVAPGLPGQWQGWHVPILLLPCPAGAGSSPEMPRRAAWRSLSRLWQQSQVHHGPKQDFWLLCSSLASDTVTVTVTCLPRNAGGAASWSWAGGCWAGGDGLQRCSRPSWGGDLGYLLLAAHLTLSSLGTRGVPALAPSHCSSPWAGDPAAPWGAGFMLCFPRGFGT